MAEDIEKAMGYTGGLFAGLKPFISSLHGYTHGGLEQLGRRFDAEGNARPCYSDEEKIELIGAGTAYFVMIAVAYCQAVNGGDPTRESTSAAIMERYNRLYTAQS